MQKWEYKVVLLAGAGESCEQELNQSGELGWELVTISPLGFIFKRPISD